MLACWRGLATATSVFGLGVLGVDALPTVPGVEIANPNWSIIMTPEGYSDVALDNRPGFAGREYLSGEWAAAIFYTGGAMPGGPIWLRKEWGFPCWVSNSNFAVDEPIQFDSPTTNADGFNRLMSKISNGDVEITIRYEMVDTDTGIEQGDERASSGGAGNSTTSDPYVLVQTYSVKNISGGPLNGVRFYHFLHGLNSGVSIYDDRAYGGAMGAYRYDNTQKGTSLSFRSDTGEIFSHADTICMHAMDAPSAIECGYYGKEPIDDHADGKPSIGTHLSIEANSLNGLDFFEPEAPAERWVSGAMGFNFPDLGPGAVHDISVLLSIRSESSFEAPAPQIRILDARIEGSEFVLDFEEEPGAPIDGFLLRTSKNLQGKFPEDWPQLPVPYTIGVPYQGANRYRIPIDLDMNPKCFFRIQPFLK